MSITIGMTEPLRKILETVNTLGTTYVSNILNAMDAKPHTQQEIIRNIELLTESGHFQRMANGKIFLTALGRQTLSETPTLTTAKGGANITFEQAARGSDRWRR